MTRAALAGTVAALIALVSGLSGCAYGARERALDARANVIQGAPGDGAVRVSVWPWVRERTAMAGDRSGWDTTIER